MVDGLAVRDREQPPAQVPGVLELRVRAEGRDEALLVDVVRVGRADARGDESQHGGSVLVEQLLKGREGDWGRAGGGGLGHGDAHDD
jgi:hypothetical protein